ncbi:MAG TPA: hypothetical protein VHH73_10155 [Verrucomicrobiae bacterium]|nr:hypothetical protein [Verrucomicrobiae bacterium]
MTVLTLLAQTTLVFPRNRFAINRIQIFSDFGQIFEKDGELGGRLVEALANHDLFPPLLMLPVGWQG